MENHLKKILVYGANGYTGTLIVEELQKRKGLTTIVAGRSEEKLVAHFAPDLEVRVFSLEENFIHYMKDIDLVIHCAGPYRSTALPMVEACLATGTHYIDITGELEVFETLKLLDSQAMEQGIVIMPGTGFDVVPTDCLSLQLKNALPDANRLELAFYPIGGGASPGTTKTVIESAGNGTSFRENGEIKQEPGGLETREHMIEGKKLTSACIPWGDVSTAYTTTGIPNIRVFIGMNPKTLKNYRRANNLKWLLQSSIMQKLIKKRIDRTVNGPTKDELQTARTYVVGKVWDDHSSIEKAILTPNGYILTQKAAVEIASRIVSGSINPGYQTPALAFGPNFIYQFEGVTEVKLQH